ncbi:T6SS immunity protein Tdi1 domain-containing protein [Achromobacter sp.]|uniref:T6SS immunity protein Tdi1 domain-containing protein n=1 Tax=Achromobacter sp. TaxID=134375 RepID=UPI0028AAB512|nr:T6SS immunity protein Tdi1 domain-containing protein [Achromobacter sp.]
MFTFHNGVLLNLSEAALAENFFKKWIASGGCAPRFDQCVGYKLPLFLGGKDDISNLELSDLDVYSCVSSQLIARTRGLPVGTAIGAITLKDEPAS